MIHVSFKVDKEEDPELAEWLRRFKGKRSRLKSYHIRKALTKYIKENEKV